MELDKESYTKDEVQSLLQEQEGNIADLTAKVGDSAKMQEQLETLTKTNLTNSIKLEMLKSGLSEDLFDLVQADDVEVAKTKISKLVELNKKNKIDNSYKPEEHKETDDAYNVAEKQQNVEGMLKSKLSKLFQ